MISPRAAVFAAAPVPVSAKLSIVVVGAPD